MAKGGEEQRSDGLKRARAASQRGFGCGVQKKVEVLQFGLKVCILILQIFVLSDGDGLGCWRWILYVLRLLGNELWWRTERTCSMS